MDKPTTLLKRFKKSTGTAIRPLSQKQPFSPVILALFALVLAGVGYYIVISSHADATCTTTLSPGDAAESSGASGDTNGTTTFDTTVEDAKSGDVVCLSSGSYPDFFIRSSQARTGYVTIEPAPGQTPVIAGSGRVANSSFLKFQDLKITSELDIADGAATASHDIQFLDNDISGTSGPRFLESNNAPITNITIEGNYIHDIDAPGACAPGGSAGTNGQGITLGGVDNVLIRNNVFKSIGWHFIQGGASGTGGVTVDHNLFTGPQPVDDQACAHMNVWQVFGGGNNDTFSNNVVVGSSAAGTTPVASNSLMFENGGGGSVCSTTMTNTVVTNNLFADEDGAYEFELMTTTNLTVTNNTITGSGYGTLVARSDICGASTNVTETGNLVTNNTNGASNFGFGACTGTCTTDYNVSQDASAGPKGAFPGTTHYVTNWSPSWQTTTWTPSLTLSAPPAGYYQPTLGSLPFAVGYQGSIGPQATGTPPDTTPPTVSVSAPSNGATVSGTTTVTATASDNVGVTSVQFKLDGVNLGSADTASPYTTSWNTTTATNGTHTLTAVASDAAGNTTTSSSVSVTVNNTTADTTPPSVPTNLTATANSSTQATLSWTASTDNVGVSGYHIYRDGSSTVLAIVTAPTVSYNDTTVAAGSTHTYQVAAFDAAGNQSAKTTAVSVTTPSSTTKVGDLNGDGVVNVLDLSILLSHYGTNYAPADLNHDNIVNIFDLSLLLGDYGG